MLELLPVLAVLALLLWMLRPVTRDQVTAWAADRSLRLDGPATALLETYLTNARRLRGVCGLLGAGVGIGLARLWDLDALVSGMAMTGAAIGAVVAGRLTRRAHADQADRPAVVVSRGDDWFGTTTATILLYVATGGLVAAWLLREPSWTADAATSLVALGLIGPISTALTRRGLAQLPYRTATDEARAVEDATRSSTLHAVIGAAIGVALVLSAELVAGDATTGARQAVASALTLVGIGIWFGYGIGYDAGRRDDGQSALRD